MDYERIDKPIYQPGGFSPSKLRAMLLGVEKLRKEEEELASRFSARSDDYSCKDVATRTRVQDEDNGFEFHKPERSNHRPGLVLPFSKPPPSKWDDAEKWIASPTANRTVKGGGVQLKKSGLMGYGNRNAAAATKVAAEVTGKKAVNWVPAEPFPVFGSDANSAIRDSADSLSHHDSSRAIHIETTFTLPPTTVQSVSMRDMGTEMTPIASNEPSQTGTPVKATTPTRSPISSRHSTPERRPQSLNLVKPDDSRGDSSKELSATELQMEVRRDIMVLGTKLGKTNITAWANQEQEDTHVSLDKIVSLNKTAKSDIGIRAAAWAEAEKAKYISRFKQEEMKIQAWENHQKARTEAEMRKTEVQAEKMKMRAQAKLMRKLEASRHKAEEMRAAAETKKNQQASITEQKAESIRRTGRIPSSSSCCGLFF